MEIPLDGMREFHVAVCSESDDLSPLEFNLRHGDEGNLITVSAAVQTRTHT